ncbi:RNB-domain-containing protein [Russula emetica]|nr:RNB-domain-containing protein [Russula emetica]
MHRARRGLVPSLISHPHPPYSVSRQLRERSTSSSKKVSETTKRAWVDSARTLLDTAAFRRAGSKPPKSHRATELRLVNSILDEWGLPTAAERGLQGVVPPMTSDLEECTSELPLGVGPGALVEIRLGNNPLIGVILREVRDEGRNVVHTLTADGRIIVHYPHDILYVVPKFADHFLVKRCGITDKPVNSKELMARVSVAGKLRAFNKVTEDLFNGYAAPFNAVYTRVSSSDEEAWTSITVVEAAKHLNAHHPDPSLVLHAVYSRLMKHSLMFAMDNHNFISSQTFYVRPRSQVGRFNQVWHLMHNDNERVREFALRAKEIIIGLRKMTENSKSEAPSYNSASDFAFTEDDQLFIKFFLDSLVDIRTVQANPYTPLICEIIKSLGLYRGDVDSEQVRQFLVDLGVLSPWQDIPSLREAQPALMTPAPLMEGKQVSKSAAITSSLGPDDFYPTDPLESIRHDFGQLPVYVIDGDGAEELDDGISIERDTADPSGLWIHVHVADPTAILPPTHSLARRARDSVYTLYFNHSSLSMLPDFLVKDKLSLGNAARTGQAENVMTFSAKVDPGGNIVDYRVRAGIIRNVRILRYDDVDAAMSFPSHDLTFPFGRPTKSLPTPLNLSPADTENLHLLDLFSKRALARRLGTSTFSHGLGRPELGVSPKPLPVGVVDLMQPGLFLGNPQIFYAVQNVHSSGSRQIVAEAAQVANRVASRFGREHGIPLAWRSLAAPVGSDEALADLLRLRDEGGCVDFFEVQRKAIQFSPSRYTLEPAEHWTLGIAEGEGYTRATSPLRRYGDLVIHWQIKHMLLHNKPLFSSKEMQTTFDHIGAKEKRCKWIEQAHGRWWALAFIKRWMESKRESGAYNPVENMIGRVTGRARQDVLRGTWIREVHIGSLGLFGILEGADSEQEIGAEVAVTVDKIMLTSHPILRLKLAHS